MQHCGKCGNHNLNESIFCSHCGNRLNYNCPSCGFSNLPQQEFCGGCGKQVADLAPPPTYVPVGGTAEETAPAPEKTSAPEKQSSSEQSSPLTERQSLPDEDEKREKPHTPAAATATLPVLEEQRHFAPYQTLEAYALLSVECANWEQLKAESASIESLEAARQRCIRTIEQQVLAAEGHLHVSKAQILFISFKQEKTLIASLQKAINFSLALLKQDFQVQGLVFTFKAGLDIEKVNARDPLTSTLERSVGKSGTLIVSEAVYQQIKDHYRTEVVGPVRMGNRRLQFHRIISAGTPLPEPEAMLEATPAPSKAQAKPTPPKPPKTVQATPQASTPQTPPSPPPTPQAAQTTPPKTQPKAAFGGPPMLPDYAPPVLAVRREARAPNLNYAQTIDALTADLSAFLAQGTANKGRIIALSAEDGLGKSSIVQMVRGRVDPTNDKAIWAGGSNYRSFSRNALPLYYWIEILQNMMSLVFEGQDRNQVQAQIEKFMAFIYDGRLPEEEAAFLFDFLSVNPPEPLAPDAYHLNGRILHFFLGFFKHLCQKRPLILIVEDLQEADPASLELLINLLANGLLDLPLCLILTQTPDFYASGAFASLLQKGPYKELNTAPLSRTEAERFLNDGPLGGRISDFPPTLIESILRYAHGLPLYLEEALRLLHLRNVVSLDERTLKFIPGEQASAEDAFLPDSLHAILRHRQGHLSDATRYLLQLAAVIGEKFSVSMLMALAQMDSEEDFNQSLTTLFNHGYLIPDAVNTGRFRHGLLCQAVYDDIPPDLRQQIHQWISEALEQDFQQGLTVNPMLIAYHAQHGGLSVRALNFWNLTGIFAGQVGALTGLNIAMTQALEFLKQQDSPLYGQEMALRIVETLGSLNVQQEPELAIDWLEWVVHYRQMTGDTTQLIEPLGALTSAYEYQGNFAQALATLEKTSGLIDANHYPMETASLQVGKLEQLYALGRYQQARELMESAIEPLANPSNLEFFEAYLQARLIYGQILTAQCDPNALKHLEETGEMAYERELTGLSIAVQLAKGHYLLRSGEYEACNREADDLLHTIEQLDQPAWFLAQWGLLAMMYHCELEDWTSASQLTLTVLSKAEEVRDYPTLVTAQIYAGYIASKQNNVPEALQMLEQAIERASDHRLAGVALLGWRFLAEFEFSLGNREVAYELVVKALEIAQKPEILNRYEDIQLTLLGARVMLAQNDVKTAGQTLENLWSHTVHSKMRPLIATCATEIGQLYKQMAHDAPADLSKKHLMRSTEFFLKAKGIWLEMRHLPNVRRVDEAIPRV